MKTRMALIHGQRSWRLEASEVEACVTDLGGHLGPVTFDRNKRRIQPFAVAPWAAEKTDPALPPILKVLRGDFFCMPFGGNSTPFRGERHPIHGETANAKWRLENFASFDGGASLDLSLTTSIREARVDKRILVRDSQNAVYSQHVITGMTGPMNFGHHAMLKFPDRPGSGVVSTSPFLYGQVFPQPTERPENRGYSALKPGAEFTSLAAVPTVAGEIADLTVFPARRGYEDIAMIVSDASVSMAWTAVTFPRERYVWLALKDPRILRSTVLWISNGGRHYPPWNGRHVNVMGLEEVTAYFHLGLAESARPNPLSDRGYPTSYRFNRRRPLRIPYIMAIVLVPKGFDRVTHVEASAAGDSIMVHSASGKTASTPLDLVFLLDQADSLPAAISSEPGGA